MAESTPTTQPTQPTSPVYLSPPPTVASNASFDANMGRIVQMMEALDKRSARLERRVHAMSFERRRASGLVSQLPGRNSPEGLHFH
jgi:hypothetical protein